MSPGEQASKMRAIAQLDAGEIEGWRLEVARLEGRPCPSEAEALIQRERQLAKGRAG